MIEGCVAEDLISHIYIFFLSASNEQNRSQNLLAGEGKAVDHHCWWSELVVGEEDLGRRREEAEPVPLHVGISNKYADKQPGRGKKKKKNTTIQDHCPQIHCGINRPLAGSSMI